MSLTLQTQYKECLVVSRQMDSKFKAKSDMSQEYNELISSANTAWYT